MNPLPSSTATSSFTLTLTGTSTLPHPAERALLNITITTTGPSKPSVSSAVLTSSSKLEKLCRSLSPPPLDHENEKPSKETTATTTQAAALAHWNRTTISFTSHQQPAYLNLTNLGNHHHPAPPRQYTARINFDVRFQDFAALGPFAAEISTYPHVEVGRIEWLLTPSTRRAFEGRLRTEAARDALRKARDYVSVLCCYSYSSAENHDPEGVNVMVDDGESLRIRAVELVEGSGGTTAMGMMRPAAGAGMFAPPPQQQMQTQMQCALGASMTGAAGAGAGTMTAANGEESFGGEGLEFRPQQIRMTKSVQVKFAVDTLGVAVSEDTCTQAQNPAKRRRLADTQTAASSTTDTMGSFDDDDESYDMISN